jgi:hypothetical protein
VRGLLIVIAVIAGLLAACTSSGAEHPSPSPTPTPSQTSSASRPATTSPAPSRTGPLTTGPGVRPGEKPPVLPAEAQEHTAIGAELFAAYYLRAVNWSIETNDGYLIRGISSASCQTCTRLVEGFASLAASSRHQNGGTSTLQSISIVAGDFTVKADRVVQLTFSESAAKVMTKAGLVVQRIPARAATVSNVFVSWIRGSWKVVEVAAP